MPIQNPRFQTEGANPGEAEGWAFSDNCDELLSDPACSTTPFPNPDGTISGKVADGFELGVSDQSDQDFTQSEGYYDRVFKSDPFVVTAGDNRIATRVYPGLALAGEEGAWTAEFFVQVLDAEGEPDGDEVILSSIDIEPGSTDPVTVSFHAAPYLGQTVQVGWRLSHYASVFATFVEEFDDGAFDVQWTDPATWDVTETNSFWQAILHGFDFPGGHFPFEVIDATNPLPEHGTKFLGIGMGDHGASTLLVIAAGVQAAAFSVLVNTRSVEISAFMRVWLSVPLEYVSLFLMARTTTPGALSGYGLTIGTTHSSAGVDSISTFGLRLKTVGFNDVFITALDPAVWHHPRLTVIPNGDISDRFVVELETSPGSGVWNVVHDETILAASPRYLPFSVNCRIGIGRGMAGGWPNNPGGFDGVRVVLRSL